MDAAPGWYPTDDGMRFWDGSRWTEHRVADSTAATVSGAASWFGWGSLIIVALVGAASSGASGLFVLSGVFVLVVAVVALIRGRVGWARLRGRAASGIALGSALALMVVGGVVADPPDDAPATVPTPTARPTLMPTAPAPQPTDGPEPGRTTALIAVAGLTVKGRAPRTGYSREAFGQTWFDVDRNGCDTRNDILRRDLTDRDMKNTCKVLAGTLDPDPYTAQTIRFEIGGADEVDVDHVVALSDAWQKGAGTWAGEKMLAFANDPLNLLAVDAGTNRSKGEGDTATWLPPNKAFRCTYVTRQVAVKAKYALWITPAERDAMVSVLSRCENTSAPTPGPAPTEAALPGSRTKSPVSGSRAPALNGPADTYYANCTAVRAASAAPIRSGQPGYSRKLDRDGDGTACE